MNANGTVSASGSLSMKVIRSHPHPLRKWAMIKAWRFKQFCRYGWRELPLRLYVILLPIIRIFIPGLNCVHSTTAIKVIKANGEVWDYGVIGCHLVVTAGKNYLASCMDNTNEPELLKFHGYGTGTTAAAAGDTGLQTELTTQYAVSNTRPTGSQAHSTNTYTTIATCTPSATVTISEWGLFTATSAGTMLDHQVFTGVPLNGTGDSIQTTYVLTFS